MYQHGLRIINVERFLATLSSTHLSSRQFSHVHEAIYDRGINNGHRRRFDDSETLGYFRTMHLFNGCGGTERALGARKDAVTNMKVFDISSNVRDLERF